MDLRFGYRVCCRRYTEKELKLVIRILEVLSLGLSSQSSCWTASGHHHVSNSRLRKKPPGCLIPSHYMSYGKPVSCFLTQITHIWFLSFSFIPQDFTVLVPGLSFDDLACSFRTLGCPITKLWPSPNLLSFLLQRELLLRASPNPPQF